MSHAAGKSLLESHDVKLWHVSSLMRDPPADFPEEGMAIRATIDNLSVIDEEVEEVTKPVDDGKGDVIAAEEHR